MSGEEVSSRREDRPDELDSTADEAVVSQQQHQNDEEDEPPKGPQQKEQRVGALPCVADPARGDPDEEHQQHEDVENPFRDERPEDRPDAGTGPGREEIDAEDVATASRKHVVSHVPHRRERVRVGA